MLIQMKITLLVEVKKKGKSYISSCQLLDVYSQGESEQKAIDNIQEALKLFFILGVDKGERKEVENY